MRKAFMPIISPDLIMDTASPGVTYFGMESSTTFVLKIRKNMRDTTAVNEDIISRIF